MSLPQSNTTSATPLVLESLTLDALVLALLNPIRAEAPAGLSIRLDEAFEALDRQVKEHDSLTLSRKPDWPRIASLAFQLSVDRTKDLLVLAYLCLALTQARRLEGLAMGLVALQRVASEFWPVLHPELKRLRARGAALDWLMERLFPWLENIELNQQDHATLKQVVSALANLQGFCGEQFSQHGPDVASLLRLARQREARLAADKAAATPPPAVATVPNTALVDALNGAPVDAPTITAGAGATTAAAVQPEPATSAPSTTTATQAPPSLTAVPQAGGANLATDKALRDYLRQLQTATRTLVESLLQQDIRDPRPYEMNRVMTWAAISSLPEVKDGKTALRAVPKERLQLFQQLREQSRTPQLLVEIEKSLANSPFWLDGHCLAQAALASLDADSARQAIETQVRGFLVRYPELVEYSFADGTPFASSDTREWLSGLQQGSSSAPAGAVSGAVTAQEDEVLHEALAQADQWARGKAMPRALGLLQDLVKSASGRAQAFRRQLGMAEFCLRHNQPVLGRALLETLHQELQTGELMDWEPELSSRVLQLMLKTEVGKSVGDMRPELARPVLLARLCQIDAVKALEFQLI